MLGGDFTPKVDLISTGADGSGDEDLLPLMDAKGVLLWIRKPGERLLFKLPCVLSSPVFNDFIVIGDGDLLSMVCS